ncbi:hypothetical protein JQS43_06135 [Natronosporangium hydrolyticum]|uniref:Malectin domain-containing protein n=1 Tax=Natronosporangium hydrolyticum TaxID=2811111 RepID=A0A895YK88_9ACTN|nr:malectin domain-containing carbohydrate-binding protein [Natronosporangium hydrolyticum]QSB15909.1 hypothetical protein JQS43_06135 [Natronosporangium hydrolyticum]
MVGQPDGAVAAGPPGHDRVVSDVPATGTPEIQDGLPQAIVAVGDRVLVGGSFSEVRDPGGGTLHQRPYLFAFDAATGAVDTDFTPSLAAEVLTLHPGPTADTVYVGGRFNHAGGNQGYNKIVLMDLTDGSVRTDFHAPPMNGAVFSAKAAGGRLYVGGKFTLAGTEERGGLVTLDPLTGDIDPFLDVHVTENHNWDGSSGAQAPVGPDRIDITPDGSTAVVIGNFRFANELDRDQVFLLDLTGEEAEIRDWHTNHFKPRCSWRSFDKWVRDVSFSPDGSYFVVVTTGGPHRNTLCDAVSRWETDATGSEQHPTWVNWSGGDTLLSVAVTETAVYAGGHQRWMNNHWGTDYPDTGAVGRPGLNAMDPVSGVDLSWNPGRNPRGYGATVLYATADGLYVGSDTDWIGNWEHYRPKLAFFPLAGGHQPPAGESATIPADVHFTDVEVEVGAGLPDILYRVNAAGPALPALDDGPEWFADNSTSSPYRNSGSLISTNANNVPGVLAPVPETTPIEVFNSTRWNPASADNLTWSFPVPAGTDLEVRLYFADRCWCTHQPGDRVMDILIDGVLVADGYDVVDSAAYNRGTMLSYPVTSDGEVEIEFEPVVEAPIVSAIEIVRDQTGDGEPGPGIGKRFYDGDEADELVAVGGADGTQWGELRGAFLVDDVLFYGMADGTFWRRSFDGSVVGLPQPLTPHLDPYWDGVQTHSGSSTYDGEPSSFAANIASMRGMYYTDGRVFYTRAGQNTLYWRWFNPENGLAGSREFTLAGSGNSGSVNNLSNTSGVLFVADGHVYWSRADDGRLLRRPLLDSGSGSEQVTTAGSASRQYTWDGSAEVVGGPEVDGVDWRTPGAFLR